MQRWKSFSRVILLLALLISLLAGVSAPAFVDADVSAAPKAAIALDVIISEVAWSGTAANSSDEWIELYNPTSSVIVLDNWKIIFADGTPDTITIPSGKSIAPSGYFLLERADSAINDIAADYVYGGSNLSNTAEVLSLADSTGFIVDTANSGCSGCWFKGSSSPDYLSMERNLPAIADSASAWTSNNGVIRNGFDAVGNPVNGTPHNSKIDLSLTMAVDNQSPSVPSNIKFTITVINNETYNSATNVSIKDVFPTAGLTYQSHNASIGSYSFGTGFWTIPTLASGVSAILEITATVTTAGVKTNRAEIWSFDQFDPDSTPGNGITTPKEDDYDLAKAITPGATALIITNAVSNPTPTVGTNIIFTITVSNPSSIYKATNVAVAALLPPTGFTYISYSSTPGTLIYNGSTGVWEIDSIEKGASVILNVTARVITSNPPSYSATVSSDEFLDSTATVTFTPLSGQADLSLAQLPYTLSTTTVGNAILKITVTNNGPDNATGVEVKDLLPSGLTFVSYNSTLSTSTYSSSTGVWAINNLANGASATLNIMVKVAASGTSTNNSAQVSKSDQFDPNSTNNSASMEVGVSDLSLLERVDLSTSAAIFTLTLSNSGPDEATGVIVKTSLPALTSAYTYSSSGASLGTYTPSTGFWNVGSLADGASATLTITTNIAGPLLVNWVEVSASGQVDPDSVPNNSSKTEDDDASAPSADLSLAQSVNNVNPNVGDNVVFTITVTNAGAGGTTNVEVRDLLPSGLTYVSNDLDTAYTKSTGIWKVGTLASGQSKALKITAKVAVNGIKQNWAEAWKSDESDPDSVPGNGSTTEDDDASASITSYRSIIINEVAWAGTGSGTSPNNLANDEWLELYNPSIATIDITGWTLKSASGSLSITLTGSIKSGEYFLLERDDNSTVSDITADQIYTSGLLSDSGEYLTLRDGSDNFIDTANKEGAVSSTNPWPKGSKLTTNYGTMERLGISVESDTTWITNTGTIKIGKDANNGTIFGTPKRANSSGATTPVIPGNPIIPTPGPRLTGRPIINEFLARPGFDWNQDGQVDVFDEYIEIKNVGAVDIVLTGWKLDDEANLGSAAFTLPAITLKPSERYVFYGLETNILLSDGGDSVRLLNPSGQILDSFTYSVAKVEDQSTCRLPDLNTNDFGFGQWLTDCIPTPNLANTREGTIPSMPGGEPFEPYLCSLPDTLPADFLFAECRGYGSDIWNTYYWDQPGWQGEQYVPENMSKWESFVK